MEKNENTNVLIKVIGFCNDTLDMLRSGNIAWQEATVRVGKIATLTEKLAGIIPSKIYVLYKEFFDSFIQLSNKCFSLMELQKNIDVYRESMQLFVECLGEISNSLDDIYEICFCCGYEGEFVEDENQEKICPNCKSTSFDRGLIHFLMSANIKEAEEGFRMVNLSHHDCVKNWMSCYCPQVEYVIGDANGIVTVDGDIIVSSERIEIDGFCTHQIDYEEGFSVYVLSKKEEETFDFSWSCGPDMELCQEGPLVSVLMSCYNHEQFVEEAILSVINQSYKNIEFIISDDASPDNTAAIIKKYEKHYSKCIYFKENGGGRTNELKKYATGKYIAIMHSDDLWHKDKLALQVEYMESHPECGSCLSWCKYIDVNNNILEDNLFIQPNRSQDEWMRFFWEEGNALCNPSSLTRIEYFYDRDWIGITGRQLPDYFKWIDSVQKFDIHIITKELIYMRRYKLEGVENTSIESNKNTFNSHIEMGANWMLCLKNMEDDFFKYTFGRYFKNEKASSKEELLCEKYFMLLNHASPFVQNSAFMFYNEYYATIKDCMRDVYNYKLPDYRNDVRTKGLMDFFKNYI